MVRDDFVFEPGHYPRPADIVLTRPCTELWYHTGPCDPGRRDHWTREDVCHCDMLIVCRKVQPTKKSQILPSRSHVMIIISLLFYFHPPPFIG